MANSFHIIFLFRIKEAMEEASKSKRVSASVFVELSTIFLNRRLQATKRIGLCFFFINQYVKSLINCSNYNFDSIHSPMM